MKLNWEYVEQESGIYGTDMYRARVPGGWLYQLSRTDSVFDRALQQSETVLKVLAMTFVPEPLYRE